MRWRALIGALLALSVLGGEAEAAHAPPKQVTTPDFAFVPPVVPLQRGDHLTLTNTHSAPHDLTATDPGSDGRPLFRSETVGPGETGAVAGTERLAPGLYGFLCSIHPYMRGAVVVSEAAAPPLPPPPDGPEDVRPVGAVVTPTSLTVHDGSLYVAGWSADAVYKMAILPGGALGPALPYATGVNAPLGIAFDAAGTLYVADSHPAATPGRSTAGRVWALPPGGGDAGDVGEIVLDELPNGRHNTNGMAVRDGRLYVTNGNSTDDGVEGGDPEQPLSGALLSVPLGARDIVVGQPSESQIRVEAVGMRNVYDVAFRPGTSEAWLTFNGLDEQDPWGEDLLLKADVAVTDPPTPPEDFGFPGCVYGRGQAPPFPFRQNLNPAVGDVCDGAHTPPEQLMGLHTSADGLAFGPSGAPWDGDLFVALFGNFFGDEVVGHEVVRVPIDADGVSGPPEDFLPGGFPLDVTFHGNDMYVADFGLGVLLVKPPPVGLP